MRFEKFPWMLAAFALEMVPAAAVLPGDGRPAVVDELGPPHGSIIRNGVEILIFDRGKVWLHDAFVVSAVLVSERELAEQQAAGAEEARRRAEARAQLAAEGRVLLEEREASSDFRSLAAEEQLRLWQIFAARYPMLDVSDKIALLKARVAAEMSDYDAGAGETVGLQELEARVRAAEARAARAEREARRRGGSWPWFTLAGRSDDRRPRGGHPERRAGAGGVPGGANILPGDSIDAARGRVMGEYERARSEVYRQAGP